MMDDTKYDLCANTAKLDYHELIKTATIAVRHSLNALDDRIKEWREPRHTPTGLHARWMFQDARDLAIATTTLHYLKEAARREEISLVNIPEYKQDDDRQ